MDTSQYYQQLAPIFDPQTQYIQQQKTALAPQYEANLSALEQAKLNAFRDIGTTARSRGMQFSGFSPEQEARYTGATYLPAVANLKAQYAAGLSALDKAIIDLGTQRQTQALSLGREDLAYQRTAAENEKQRQFQREQSALDRSAGKYSGGGSTTRTLSRAEVFGSINTELYNARGDDGYVSPTSYKNAKQDAMDRGISGSDFDDYFAQYVNPSHSWDYSSKYEDQKPAPEESKKKSWWDSLWD